MAAPLGYRPAASGASARTTTASRAGGTPATRALGDGGAAPTRASAIASVESPVQARTPVRASYRTRPSPYTSEAGVVVSPRACSGLK